jgi:ClpP class serine protease
MDKAAIEEKVFKGPLIEPNEAVKVGLVDGIMSVDEVLSKWLVT